jgi:hypothetical protein
MAAHFHFTENTFTLHFLFQRAQGLVNVIITYDYFNHLLVTPFRVLSGCFDSKRMNAYTKKVPHYKAEIRLCRAVGVQWMHFIAFAGANPFAFACVRG